MIIVIPFGSEKEKPLLKLLTQAVCLLGKVKQPVLIASTPSLLGDANAAADVLRRVCASVEVVSTENEFAHGWFRGPNRMFYWVVEHLEMKDSHEPFLWLEIDACPVVKGWSDKLEAAYEEAGMPHFGFVRPTNHKNPDGSIYTKQGDNMLLGVSIYPPHMLKNPGLAPLMRNLSIENEKVHAPYPWDIYLRWQFFKKGVHATHLIYDRWCTVNYKRGVDGKLVCEPHPDFPTAKGGEIPVEALLVHGCKDETLHRLIIAENTPAPVFHTPVIRPAPVMQPMPVARPAYVAPAPVVRAPVLQPVPRPAPPPPSAPAQPAGPRKPGRPVGSKTNPVKLKRQAAAKKYKHKLPPLDMTGLTDPADRVKMVLSELKARSLPFEEKAVHFGARIGPIGYVREVLSSLGYEVDNKGIIKPIEI